MTAESWSAVAAGAAALAAIVALVRDWRARRFAMYVSLDRELVAVLESIVGIGMAISADDPAVAAQLRLRTLVQLQHEGMETPAATQLAIATRPTLTQDLVREAMAEVEHARVELAKRTRVARGEPVFHW